MYLATLPWLKRRALDVKVKYNCEFLSSAYLHTFNSHIMDEEIIAIYCAQAFDDGKPIDDTNTVEGRNPPPPQHENYEVFDTYLEPYFPRAVDALTSKYLTSLPWMGILKPGIW